MLSSRRRPRAPAACPVHISWAHSSQLHLLVFAPEPVAHDGGDGAASASLGDSGMTSSIPTFPTLLQRFFTQRLMQQKRVSANTISSYRDTFRLLLRFARKRLRTPPNRLAFEKLDAPLVAAFLNELETTRGVTVRTRNLRLTAIRSFFRFAAYEMPTRSAQIQRVLALPAKRFDRKLIDFLTRPEVDALLDAPDKSTWSDRRDHALLLTTLQTGLRLSEATGLRRQHVTFGTGA